MTAPRSWLVLTDGYLESRNAKTAHGVLRYSRERIAAVLDRDHAGSSLADVLPEMGRDAPIVGSFEEGAALGPTSLLLGVATPGGWIPDHWRAWMLDAARSGMEIANGLHRFLRDDEELVATAEASGARLWDVRQPPDGIPLCSGKALEAPQRLVLTVGSDCAVGKMTASLELVAAAEAAGRRAEFVATGQTGILIAGKGIAVDRVISDFVSGASEQLVLDGDPSSEVLVIEGQGGLWHPAYSGVTLGLLHGTMPEVLVLVHQARRTAIEEPPFTKLPPLRDMIETYEQIGSVVRPCRVACVAVNCRGLSDDDARAAIAEVHGETGLPAGDVVRGDAPMLWEAVAAALDQG